MRETLSKIVKILDGQPTIRRGQSMVEMALTAPLLVLMVLGLVEIGFFANNYLILLDAVRTAGRVAVNQDPTDWPYNDARDQQRMDCDTDKNLWLMIPNNNQLFAQGALGWQPGQRSNLAANTPSYPYGYPTTGRGQHLMSFTRNPYRDSGGDSSFKFFDSVACQVINAMSPLVLNDSTSATGRDDVVVSAISYAMMDYSGTAKDGPLYNSGPGIPANFNTWITVTGRWPIENRYCNANGKGDARDPFDWKRSDFLLAYHNGKASQQGNGMSGDSNPASTAANPIPPFEGPTTDPNNITLYGPDYRILDSSTANDSQNVRGFVFTGNHLAENINTGQVEGSGCIGSDFTVQDIEQRLNLADAGNQLNTHVPNGGLSIVEVFWQYHPLFFGPLFQGFRGNDKTKDPVLHVWSFYPVPAVEPTATPSS